MDDIDLSILTDLESHPDELRERLTEADLAQLDRLLGLFGYVSDEEGLRAIGLAVASHVRSFYPGRRPGPAAVALDHGTRPGRGARTASPDGRTARSPPRTGPAHDRTAGGPRPGPEQQGSLAPSPWDLIRDRLLSATSLSEAQVRDVLGQDPRHPHLIRLTRKGGEVRLPSFQFQEDCTPVPLVLAINEVLRASKDPWGAADWWLGRNYWLGTAPTEVLGSVPDDELMAAARAVGEGD